MPIAEKVFSVERPNGYISNCWIHPKEGDSNLIDGSNNTLTVALNGYAIIPLELLAYMWEEEKNPANEALFLKIKSDQARLKAHYNNKNDSAV